jgi:hypothetical protein
MPIIPMGPLTTSAVEIQRIVEGLNEPRGATQCRLGIARSTKRSETKFPTWRVAREKISQECWRIRDGRKWGAKWRDENSVGAEAE